MSAPPRPNRAPNAAWDDLEQELDRWGAAGRVAGLWWRDDDAATATPRLARLLALAEDVPLSLAVIPAVAQPALAMALAQAPNVAVLQHGWSHANHARNGKKSEFPETRLPHDVATELAAGGARLRALFGERALPVLAPPWNRFAECFMPLLAELGLDGLSRKASGVASPPAWGLHRLAVTREVDVHLDLIAWKKDRSFIGTPVAIAGLVGELQARRLGATAVEAPIGILTHHLVMDTPTGEFLRRLCAVIRGHRAVRWLTAAELFERSTASRRAALR